MTTISLPKPSVVIPQFTNLPKEVQDAIEHLSRPFPIEEIRVRPGPVRHDGSAALALAYVDWWTGYLPRLNELIGPNNWQIDLEPWGEDQILARLCAFGGLIKGTSSGSAKGEQNGAQEAEVQAKKRVCAEKLLLGQFFYFLPKVWGNGERRGKEFVFTKGEEQRCVYEMYRTSGLIVAPRPIAIPQPESQPAERHEQRTAPRTVAPTSPTSARPQPNERTTAARQVLQQTEQRVGVMSSEDVASDAQLGRIAGSIYDLRRGIDNAELAEADAFIDAIGVEVGLSRLSTLNTKTRLREQAGLTKSRASLLITRLNQALANSQSA